MKTDDLIALMAADAKPARRQTVPRKLLAVGLFGAALALAVLVPWIGMRDMGEAVATGPYWMKTAYTLGLGVAGYLLAERLARPAGTPARGVMVLLLVLGVLLSIAMVQLTSMRSGDMPAALMGSTWDKCPWRIVVLSLPGLLAGLLAMRALAPTRPALAGAGLGLFVGGVGATIYGLHCAETSAAFTLIWYTAGIGLTAAIGALAGWRLLRW